MPLYLIFGVYEDEDLTIIYPKPWSTYLKGTIGLQFRIHKVQGNLGHKSLCAQL